MIRLHSLNIQAFRGIRDRIEVDLSAPITLIYAANGSGKTTICEAAEWLLTGSVRRLDTLRLSDEIRCRFSSDDTPTLVSANIEVHGEPLALERTLRGCKWRRPNDDWRTVTQSTLLDKLAPSAVEEGVHKRHANSSRQIWLRGTRFLSGETLATLLDSDDESLTGRQRLFADLLGVGHLLETERQLDGYISEISQAVRKQQALLEAKDAVIRDRAAKLGSELDNRERDRLVDISYFVQIASNLLKTLPTDPAPATYNSALAAVAAIETNLEGRRIGLEQRRRAESELSADWPQKAAIGDELLNDRARLGTLSDEEKTNDTEFAAASDEIAQATVALNNRRATLNGLTLAEKALGEALSKVAAPLAAYSAQRRIINVTLDAAFQMIDDDEHSSKTRSVSRLQSLIADLPSMEQQAAQLPVQKRAFEEAEAAAPTPEILAETQNALSDASNRLQELRLRYESASGPLDQLRHLSLNVVSLLGDNECICPVCTHNWVLPGALRGAIEQGLSKLPASLMALENQLREAEARQQSMQGKLLSETQSLSKSVEAERQYRRLESALNDFNKRVSDAQLEPNLASLRQAVEQAINQIDLIAALRELRETLHMIDEHVGTTEYSGVLITKIGEHLQPALSDARDREQQSLRVATDQLATAQTRQQISLDIRRRLQTERENLERRIRQNTRRLQVLNRAWNTLAGSEPQSDSKLREVSANLTEEFDNLQLVEQAIGQARVSLQKLATEQELETLQQERSPLARERDRLTHYCESAISIKQAYAIRRVDHVNQQMADIVRAISALFTRMQANLVYDDIASGDSETPLSWRAFAENLSLDPEATFSQGQRQDFALSIFLARARGLGGTFLLDEPVAHLDDLNRVALLDVFRAIAIESSGNLSFVLTTANKPLVRHLVEKFGRLSDRETLCLIEVEGNPRTGVNLNTIEAASV